MAAATATPQPNGVTATPSPLDSQTFKRISAVPVVADSISFAQSTIHAHPLLSRVHQLGESAVYTSLKVASPVTSRIQPQLTFADQQLVKTIDFAESKFPYPFHATSDDLVSKARAPADQAYAVVHAYADAVQRAYSERVIAPAKSIYDARIAPVAGSAHAQFEQLKSQNAYLQRATDVVTNLQQNLAKTLESISSRGKHEGDQAVAKAQGLSNAIFSELERVRHYLGSLPTESRKRIGPLQATFTESYEKLTKEARDTSVPITTRLSNVVKYVQTESIPALQKAIVSPPASPSAKPTVAPAASS